MKVLLFIAIYPREKEQHGKENEDSNVELVGEEQGADNCREHVGCGVAVFLKIIYKKFQDIFG